VSTFVASYSGLRIAVSPMLTPLGLIPKKEDPLCT
jgi:hypothetical protein